VQVKHRPLLQCIMNERLGAVEKSEQSLRLKGGGGLTAQ
jgi:hypothetical protein